MAPRLGLFLIWAGVSVILQLHPVNGDDELTRDKSEESHEDEACVFPFTYKDKKHFDCTFHGSIFPWCSLDADYVGRWKFCSESDHAKMELGSIASHKKELLSSASTVGHGCIKPLKPQ
ncbi:hypothetical protein AB1E19_013472 [Capra hircus]